MVASTPMSAGQLITAYLQIRDRKRAMEAAHKEALKPYAEGLYKIEMALGAYMDESGLDNLPGGGGTAYKSTVSSVTVADWDAFLGWVRETESWHALEHRASKPAIDEILEETKELPPGLNISREININVRKT